MDTYKNTQQIRKRYLPAALLALAFVQAAGAQNVPFELQYTQGPLTTILPNDGVLTLAAALGQSQTIQVRAKYIGTGTATITQPPSLSGSAAFSAAVNGSLPVTLTTGQTFFFSVSFVPVTAAADSGRLAVLYAENPASSITPITLTLQGVSAAVVPSYTTPDDNNVVQLTGGATLPFPDTVVGQTTSVGLNFTNIGSLLGQVTRVSVTGSAFVLQNLPLFPANVTAGQTLQMRVAYRPTATGPSTGTLTVEIAGASPLTVQLRATATAPKLSYQAGSPAAAIVPGGTLALTNVEVGQTSSSVFRVTNTGTAPVVVNSIATVGAAFQASSVPVLPQTLGPNGSLVFAVDFTPGRTGAQTGTLVVNTDVFNLSGSGLGPQLTFSYTVGGTTVTLGGGNSSVIFSPVRITESAQIGLDIRNTGTTAATIQNIGIGQTGSAFSIVNPAALPATVAAGATLRVNLRFEPVVVGFANSTLIADTNSITLTGSGTAPPVLPAYTLSGPSGTAGALTQPNVGLKLASPYPVALIGTLTLAPSAGNLPPDPAVQFATGGRTVNFRIPANSTDAIFGTQGTQLGLQTGTVAGTVTLTPSFATQAGNVDLTPSAPLSSQFTVAPAAPVLLSAQVINPTATGFTVQLTGYSTTRTLTGMNVQLTPAAGYQMANTQFAIDLKTIAAAWFQNTASQAFGGQFKVSIPFTFQVPATTVPAGQTAPAVFAGITSVSATVANETGTSAALQARVQ